MTDVRSDAVPAADLAAEGATALPAKEVMSLLDLNANLDLGLDGAAPIDLAVGANANVAAPIDAAVGANVLSPMSEVGGGAAQSAEIHQGITGDAGATADQQSGIGQTGSDTATPEPASSGTDAASSAHPSVSEGNALDGPLLNVNANVDGNINLAAPVDGAVAAQANVAAPIDASVAANIDSTDSSAVSLAQQDVLINQTIDGNATADGAQQSTINQ